MIMHESTSASASTSASPKGTSHTTLALTRSTSSTTETRSFVDFDLPALADASDCEESACSSDASKSPSPSPARTPARKTRTTANLRVHLPVEKRERERHSSKPREIDSQIDACISKAVPAPVPVPGGAHGHGHDSSSSRTCASLLCISEFFNWDGDLSQNSACYKRTATDCIRPDNANASSRSSSSATARSTETEAEADYQMEMVRTCIEMDIWNLMSCSAEGAKYWVNNFGQSILCNSCIPNDRDGDGSTRSVGYTGNAQSKCKCDSSPGKKIRNRNVYNRGKAMRRIESLKESGLSRNFSLAQVSVFLEEEANTEREDLSHRRRAAPILRTCKSSDYSKVQKRRRARSLFRNAEPAPRHDFFHSMGLMPTMVAIPSSDSVDSGVELYYDSDPGPSESAHADNSEEEQSHTADSNASQTFLQTLDIKSFDLNDAVLVSQIIRVSNFL